LKISQADNQYHKKQILHEKISSKFSKKSEPEGLVTESEERADGRLWQF